MKIKKNELKNIFLLDFIIGIITILILKVYNPEFSNLTGFISAVLNKDTMAIFYICFLCSFLLVSFISFCMGLHVISSRTIGRFINYLKGFMGNLNYTEYNHYVEFDEIDILLYITYLVLVMPLMLYIILSSFATF